MQLHRRHARAESAHKVELWAWRHGGSGGNLCGMRTSKKAAAQSDEQRKTEMRGERRKRRVVGSRAPWCVMSAKT